MAEAILSIGSSNGGGFAGIDISNVIESNPTLPYTATQDCWVHTTVTQGTNYHDLYLDGFQISNNGYNCYLFFPIKKGQVISGKYYTLTIFGLKN